MKKRYSVKIIEELFENRQIQFMSNVYTNCAVKYKWRCLKCDRTWSAAVHSVIMKKTGCADCSHATKITIKEMYDLAHKNDGKCLSRKYISTKDELKWKCQFGHTWWAKPAIIKRGSWCPKCKGNINEEKCRFIFESLIGEPFPRTRKIMGKCWELDGFCEKLNIAFEYQGIQHYKRLRQWYTEDGFQALQKRDKDKSELCRQKGIKKINIPYYEASDDNRLQQSIENWLTKNNIDIVGEVNWEKFVAAPDKLEKIKQIAKERNIICLSTYYSPRIKFQCCICSRIWETKASHFRRGTGCKRCSHPLRKTLEDMTILAEDMGGHCRSTMYKNESTKLIWECHCGHIWERSYSNIRSHIKRGSWCPKCAKKTMIKTRRKNAEKKKLVESKTIC